MNGKDLFDAVEFIGADIIDMAEKRRFKRSPWRTILASAAIFAMLLGVGSFLWLQLESGQADPSLSVRPSEEAGTDDAAEGVQPEQESALPRTWDPDFPVTDEELGISNGIALGMTLEEVRQQLNLPQLPDLTWDEEHDRGSFRYGGVDYVFRKQEESQVLCGYALGEEAEDLSVCREFRIGDPISAVFEEMPVRDHELKQWATQALYEANGYRADLEYVDLDHYQIKIETRTATLQLCFTAEGTRVESISAFAHAPEQE